MTLNISSWSNPLSMSKPRSTTTPKKHNPPPPTLTMSHADSFISSSRSSSLAGRKRPRETDADLKSRLARRTKSTGDARVSGKSKDKDREAFQRGLIAVFVPNALKESLVGRSEHYDDLLAHFLPSPLALQPSLPPLLPLLRALTAHVSLLSTDAHSSLVSAIIALPWAAGEEKFVRVYIGFCGVLVSSQPGWAKEVVSMAIKGLRWRKSFCTRSLITAYGRTQDAIDFIRSCHTPTLPCKTPSPPRTPLVTYTHPSYSRSAIASKTFSKQARTRSRADHLGAELL